MSSPVQMHFLLYELLIVIHRNPHLFIRSLHEL